MQIPARPSRSTHRTAHAEFEAIHQPDRPAPHAVACTAIMAERPLFDPSRIQPPEPPPTRGVPTTLTPRQVNDLVRGAIAARVPSTLHVLAEVGDFSRAASGHVYMTLKDSTSELRAVMWRAAAAKLRFEPRQGLEVIATGALEVYSARGAYQLIVRKLEPRGVGALELALRQLREKLAAEGLFDSKRKRPLPRFPRRVALVTSPTGAAIRDILQTIVRRFPKVEILLFPVPVQGEGAAARIAEAIRSLNQSAAQVGGIDVAIVGRGGGSLEDLWAFNEEAVARAIAASQVPIVSAVGHEIDVSISDLVADVRAATPTAAAELVTPLLVDLMDDLANHQRRAGRAVRHRVDALRSELAILARSDPISRPLAPIREAGQRLDEALQRVAGATERMRDRARQRLMRSHVAMMRFGAGAALAELSRRLEIRRRRCESAAARRSLLLQRRLQSIGVRARSASPLIVVRRSEERLEQLIRRLHTAMRQVHANQRARWTAAGELLAACDPRRVVRRGYAIIREAGTRRVVRSVFETPAGTRVLVELADGEVPARVEDARQRRLFD